MKTTFLYIKESPKGLKYLGKTIKDPFKYRGSGLVWKRHLKSNKYNYSDIKTTILLETTDYEELKAMGLYYSKLYDIVNSEEWANLRPESGDGGDTSMCPNYKKPPKHFGDSSWTKTPEARNYFSERIKGDKNPSKRPEIKEKIRQKAIGRKHSDESKLKMSEQRRGENNAFYGKKHSSDAKSVMKEKAKGRYSIDWFKSKFGDLDGEIKYKHRCEILSNLRYRPYVRKESICPHCSLMGKGPNMKRYHFDNCKQKIE